MRLRVSKPIAITALVFLLLSAVIAIWFQLGEYRNHVQAQKNVNIYKTEAVAEPTPAFRENTTPKQIDVPSQGIELTIKPGLDSAGAKYWQLSSDAAYEATINAKLGSNPAQVVLYAHNKDYLFGKIKQLQVGDQAIVTDEFGQKYEFSLTHHRLVLPTDTSVLNEQPSELQLVLITCDGWLDDHRYLAYFSLLKRVQP